MGCTARLYGCSVHTTRLYGPYRRHVRKKYCPQCFLRTCCKGVYGCTGVRVCTSVRVCTGAVSTRPVHTARLYGPCAQRVWTERPYTPVQTARADGPFVRAVCIPAFRRFTNRIIITGRPAQSAAMPVLFLLSSPKIGFSSRRGDTLPR